MSLWAREWRSETRRDMTDVSFWLLGISKRESRVLVPTEEGDRTKATIVNQSKAMMNRGGERESK